MWFFMTEQAPPPIDMSDLVRAIRSDRLQLVYQPKIVLDGYRLAGVEALARWRHPILGPVPTTDFIAFAEAAGLIDTLTEWAVTTAATAWTAWQQRGLITDIAVNFSARSLDRREFPDIIERLCEQHGMPCEHLVIEVTESAASGQVDVLETLTQFGAKGCKISLDDFGTGYSSLVQILKAPFAELKIDRSVVVDCDTSKDCRTLLKAIIDLAHHLGLSTVAEGVETQEVATLLAQLGCDMAQGYFFSPPLAAQAIPGWVETHRAQQVWTERRRSAAQ
jgi:EAL domain-containing protein (putative c-di-GMP-specific phosphodiesterase class I)